MDPETSAWIDALLVARHDMIEEGDFGGMVFLGLWWGSLCTGNNT